MGDSFYTSIMRMVQCAEGKTFTQYMHELQMERYTYAQAEGSFVHKPKSLEEKDRTALWNWIEDCSRVAAEESRKVADELERKSSWSGLSPEAKKAKALADALQTRNWVDERQLEEAKDRLITPWIKRADEQYFNNRKLSQSIERAMDDRDAAIKQRNTALDAMKVALDREACAEKKAADAIIQARKANTAKILELERVHEKREAALRQRIVELERAHEEREAALSKRILELEQAHQAREAVLTKRIPELERTVEELSVTKDVAYHEEE
ncbi:Hypothetical protein POVN_LOCUS36 [uncultured virus]|nr:Hypothetical protein POVN_LOCUS36 [uncultured virus]